MRVLVTRPKPAAARTAARLRELGHDAVTMPLSAARHFPESISQVLSKPASGLVVTSAEALRAIGQTGDLVSIWKKLPIFAVGAATAQEAQALQFENVIAGNGDGALLAEIISSHAAGEALGAPLLYLAGTPRAQSLEQALREAAIPFEVCECYRMDAVQPSLDEQLRLLRGRRPDAVLHYSSESLRRFMELQAIVEAPQLALDIVPYCLSRVIAEKLPGELYVRAKIAPNPSEESLLSLLSPAGSRPRSGISPA
ncbi:uroporphyrinogen-III synthase [Ciceribacter sp. L1K23]|nr:uroporphyrinogen-III synthase [Ciceribacter sp. L1K23]MBR0554154.1 uroporphyrinogen-III synthase [Ciceribacter sp. L1K23]